MVFRSVLIVVILSVSSFNANATLVDGGEFSTDTEASLDWLKLDNLVGYSYDQVIAGALGYTTSGWRYATSVEILDLFTRYIGEQNDDYWNFTIGPSALSSTYFEGANDLVVKLGINHAFNDARAVLNSTSHPGLHQITVQGIFDDDMPDDPRQGFAEATAVIADLDGSYDGFADVPHGRWGFGSDILGTDLSSVTRSSFLVRATTVPEPSTLALLGVGLVGMGFLRKQQRLGRNGVPID